MAHPFELATVLTALVLPLFGGGMLVLSKLASGAAARRAEARFMAALVVMVVVTIRTAVVCDPQWLIHTMTVAVMVLGALMIPQLSPDATA
ncbi:MAG: hypothetical protein AAGA03_17010 [Planctomycetota bacterium]